MINDSQETPVVAASAAVSAKDDPSSPLKAPEAATADIPADDAASPQDEEGPSARSHRSRQPRARQAKPRQRSPRRKAADTEAPGAPLDETAAEARPTPAEAGSVLEAPVTGEDSGVPAMDPDAQRGKHRSRSSGGRRSARKKASLVEAPADAPAEESANGTGSAVATTGTSGEAEPAENAPARSSEDEPAAGCSRPERLTGAASLVCAEPPFEEPAAAAVTEVSWREQDATTPEDTAAQPSETGIAQATPFPGDPGHEDEQDGPIAGADEGRPLPGDTSEELPDASAWSAPMPSGDHDSGEAAQWEVSPPEDLPDDGVPDGEQELVRVEDRTVLPEDAPSAWEPEEPVRPVPADMSRGRLDEEQEDVPNDTFSDAVPLMDARFTDEDDLAADSGARTDWNPDSDIPEEPYRDYRTVPVDENFAGEPEALEPLEDFAPRDVEDAAAVTGDVQSAEDGEQEAAPRARKSRRGKRGGRRGGRAGRKAREREEAMAGAGEEEGAPDGMAGSADEDVRPGGRQDRPARDDQDEPAAERIQDAREPADEEDLPSSYVPKSTGKRRMYISILSGEQVEVAITNNGLLDEYYLDMLHQKKIKGNIYRGVIHNIDSNLQAAFVDFGAEKNGFLQIDEIHPEYYITHHEPTRGKKFPPIQKVLRIGQEVLVQVVKEPNGSKGAFLTTWISLAGRFLVLTPGLEQIGISRKVNDEGERSRLRELMAGIDPGEDLGVIVRTVSAGVTRATLQADLLYLKRTWTDVRARATEVTAPACVYKEPSLPERAIRDYLTDDVCEVWVDDVEVAKGIRNTVALLFPNKKDLVRLHADARHSMWERFNLRRQLDQIYSREVLMPSGGRLVFDQTEALMAIDINSGRISGKGNFEAMAFRTNIEAAETIARQLKLRDIGGQVVIDFIEMREHKHVAEVEKTLKNAMRNDRARHDIARMSSFGLLELVRQRTGTSAISISMEPCPACGGTGLRRNLEWQSLQALRELARQLRSRNVSPCQFELPQELALYLLNHKRDALKDLENQYEKTIEIVIKA